MANIEWNDPYAWASQLDPYFDNYDGLNNREKIISGKIDYLNRVKSLGRVADSDIPTEFIVGRESWVTWKRRLFYNKIWMDNTLELIWKYASAHSTSLRLYLTRDLQAATTEMNENIRRVLTFMHMYHHDVDGGFYNNGNGIHWRMFNGVSRETRNNMWHQIHILDRNQDGGIRSYADIPDREILFLAQTTRGNQFLFRLDDTWEDVLPDPLTMDVRNSGEIRSVLYRHTGFITDCIYKYMDLDLEFVCPIRITKVDKESIPLSVLDKMTNTSDEYLDSLISVIEYELGMGVDLKMIDDAIKQFCSRYEKLVNARELGMTPVVIRNDYLYLNDISNVIADPSKDAIPEKRCIYPSQIFSQDMLVEYPIDGFDSYLSLLRNVINDPSCTFIYMTLYRIGSDSTLPELLCLAKSRGIDVRVNIELHARGDEEQNLHWKTYLEKSKVWAVNLRNSEIWKVHCKLTLIGFDNGSMISQIGTGNYHTVTAAQYTDLSLITANDGICLDVKKIFNYIFDSYYHDENLSYFPSTPRLLTTPGCFREDFIYLISKQGEMGPDGYIGIKCNELSDPQIIGALKTAYNNDCHIDLVVRGACCMTIPHNEQGICKSIVWDKLEHSRVYCFGRSNPDIYIGSLDLVKAKIDHRLEVLVRITNPDVLLRLTEYMNEYITNSTNSWIKTISGGYNPPTPQVI